MTPQFLHRLAQALAVVTALAALLLVIVTVSFFHPTNREAAMIGGVGAGMLLAVSPFNPAVTLLAFLVLFVLIEWKLWQVSFRAWLRWSPSTAREMIAATLFLCALGGMFLILPVALRVHQIGWFGLVAALGSPFVVAYLLSRLVSPALCRIAFPSGSPVP